MRILNFLSKSKNSENNNVKQKERAVSWSKLKDHLKQYLSLKISRAAAQQIIRMHCKSPKDNYKHYFKQGINHLRDRKFIAGIKSFNIALKYNNQESRAHYHKALCLQEIKKYKEAIEGYNTVLELDPKSPGSCFNRGKCLFKIGKYEEAIEDFKQTIKSQHKSSFDDAYFYLCLSYKAIGKKAHAVFNLAEFLRHRQNSSEAYTRRDLDIANHHKMMIEDYCKAFEQDLLEDIINLYEESFESKKKPESSTEDEETSLDDYQESYLEQGYNLLKSKKYGEAIEAYTKHLETSPKDRTAYYGRGQCWANNDNLYKAIDDFNKAIELDPDYNMPYFTRAVCYSELCNYDASIKDYKTFIKLTQDNAFLKDFLEQKIYKAQELLITVLIKAFRKDELHEFISKLDVRYKGSKALYFYAKAREAKDWHFDNEEALELAGKALRQDPMLIGALRLKAEIHQSCMDREQEISDLEKIIKIDSSDAEANLRLAELLRDSDPDRATELFINAIEKDFVTASDRYLRDYVQDQAWKTEHDPVVEFINKKKKELGFGPIEKKYTGYGTKYDETDNSIANPEEQQGWNEAMLLTDIKELEKQLQNLDTTNDIGIIKESLKEKYQKLLNIYAQSENYEKAAEIRDILKKIR